MKEDEFWALLERRVTAEFAGLDDPRLRRLWCDGFAPDQYVLDGEPGRIAGTAWIGNEREQEQWTFALLLHPRPSGRSSIEWASVLPTSDTTGWLAPNPSTKHLEIDPAAAEPDNV